MDAASTPTEPSIQGMVYSSLEQRLHALTERCAHAVWEVDTAGRTLFANAALCKLLEEGCPTDQVITGMGEYFAPGCSLDFASIAQKPEGAVWETELIGREGTHRHVVISASPLFGAEGALHSVQLVLTDITHCKQLETELREARRLLELEGDQRSRELIEAGKQNALLSAAVANLPMGVVITDATHPDNPVIFANPGVLRVTGYTAEELRGKNLRMLQGPASDPRGAAALHAAIAAGESATVTLQNYRKDGTVFWNKVTLSPVHRASCLTHWVGLLMDVTQGQQNKEALRLASAEAMRANSVKSEFISRMSHELRTPLNAIVGFAQLFEAERLTPEDQESLAHIHRASKHLLELINEILDFATIDTGKLALLLKPVSVPHCVEHVLREVADAAGERAIGFEGESDCNVFADEHRFRQVLQTVIGNALKLDSSGGDIVVRCRRSEGTIRVEVRDSGPGIPAEHVNRIFSPFEYFDDESDALKSTGIGLALSKQLVEAMGGSIGFTTSVRGGSSFWIDLPAARSEASSGSVEKADAEGGEGDAAPVILCIEDDLQNLRLMERVLAECGRYRLLAVMRGVIGWEMACAHLPDLIILDVNLPDLSGVEVLRRLRADEATASIPVIILSEDVNARFLERLLQEGAQAQLAKPLDPKLLGSEVARWVGASTGSRQGEAGHSPAR